MSTLVLLEAKAKAGRIAELMALFRKELPSTRSYEGCRGITAHTGSEDDHAIVLVEHWDSAEHYRKYLAWREETGLLAQLSALFEGPASIRYFDSHDA